MIVIYCSNIYLLKTNLNILLGISIGTMIYVIITYFNDSALVYVFIYMLLILTSYKLLQFAKDGKEKVPLQMG